MITKERRPHTYERDIITSITCDSCGKEASHPGFGEDRAYNVKLSIMSSHNSGIPSIRDIYLCDDCTRKVLAIIWKENSIAHFQDD